MSDRLVERLRPHAVTIFAEMSALAATTGALNLGQGFPDTDGPASVKEAAIAAIEAGRNQYPPGIGASELRAAVVDHQRRFYGIDLDPATEVLPTVGATEAIAAAILGLCEPGDEVVMFDPAYDSYAACVAMAGAVRRPVALRAPDWSFDPTDLEAAITSRTRLILLNSPHNPTGKVFTRAELDTIAAAAVAHDLIVVTDEVYEHLVYTGDHVPIATLPGMADRTLTISSGGKTFSFTGWKVGWACGRTDLVGAVRAAKQFLTYSANEALQVAIATGLGLPDEYYDEFRSGMQVRHERLRAGLAAAGLEVLAADGTYFVTVDIRSIGETDGLDFCRSLPQRCGVVAVPSRVFYADSSVGAPFVRFACCKRPEVIDEACDRLAALSA